MQQISRHIINLAGQSAFKFWKTAPVKQKRYWCHLLITVSTPPTCLYCRQRIYTTMSVRLFSLKTHSMEHDSSKEIGSRHEQSYRKTYEDAIKKLNLLQANKSQDPEAKLNFVRSCLTDINLTLGDLDKLSVIHIAGTKGKGSTCAYTESILHHKGYKTGFFSSPHLIEVRERIRINGVPLSKEDFTKYFWICYDQLLEKKEQMPSYFQFLTLMAVYVFHKEDVDVAVIEVGLGGLYDCTNIVENPVVCGITHLGIDHVNVLGNTLESIAAHKAGIFKTGSIAVTAPQKEAAMKVLKQTATDKNCSLYLSPPFSSYEIVKENPAFYNKEPFEYENMALAIQLSRIWMDQNNRGDTTCKVALQEFEDSKETIPVLDPVVEDVNKVIEALTSNQWLGRVQVVKRHNITYYLDGAHNEDSIKLCCEWFKKKSAEEIRLLSDNQKVVKILMFNITGARNSLALLDHLMECNFDLAVFTPNICYSEEVLCDQLKLAVTTHDANKVCQTNENFWRNLQCNRSCGDKDKFLNNNNKYNEPNQQPNSDVVAESETHVFESIHDCIFWCSQGKDKALNKRLSIQPSMPSILEEADHVQILVTGSLYLVGGVLTIFKDSEALISI
ncbi:folylpolyglutamate synthase, mitochondrial isoform X1 [Octopus bimaculoides]|uniref:Folylpolyglutamate synthase n=1 Tax=Octopus bimaculoides TaxID=37653 RepID=A0A0L8GA45_OCTBM|nr:folylpolyglutamate synthase, mitochondrial isoform X1 [Octopus bimaculoides]|eukprot:XP_014782935.1 PREDICTED: folylpolyglutamate synthase, mitochondrial-like isoform X1 [Octopus bimaculoides]